MNIWLRNTDFVKWTWEKAESFEQGSNQVIEVFPERIGNDDYWVPCFLRDESHIVITAWFAIWVEKIVTPKPAFPLLHCIAKQYRMNGKRTSVYIPRNIQVNKKTSFRKQGKEIERMFLRWNICTVQYNDAWYGSEDVVMIHS